MEKTSSCWSQNGYGHTEEDGAEEDAGRGGGWCINVNCRRFAMAQRASHSHPSGAENSPPPRQGRKVTVGDIGCG
eukprot:7867602-Pyramimonas_sp.AAC.1